MLKKSTSVILASLRDSTYRSVRLASSLAAALLDSLFEHPELVLTSASYERFQRHFVYKSSFPQPARYIEDRIGTFTESGESSPRHINPGG
jgi:hypothetical protein